MSQNTKLRNIPMYPGGLEIGEDEKREVLEVLDRKYLFRYYGPENYPSKVAQLEQEFAQKFNAPHALAVTSGTAALITGLIGAGVGPGDEVIVPGYTFFASCAAVVAARAIPVIAEVDASLTLDPADVKKKITPRTKAILPVHMRGVGCRMDAIMALAREHNLKVIEDVAQACGGTYQGRYLGTFGTAGCFSFQFHKIITAGEGGMILTADPQVYKRCMNYHDTGACWRPKAQRYALPSFAGELFFGVNYRMSELHGAVMRAQLKKLDHLLELMRRNKRLILEQLGAIEPFVLQTVPDPAGDAAICLILFAPDEQRAQQLVEKLKPDGITVKTIQKAGGLPDWHIYSHWRHLIDKLTMTPEGCPFTCQYYKGPTPKYDEHLCPNTLNWLKRSVHLDIPPQMNEAEGVTIGQCLGRRIREFKE